MGRRFSNIPTTPSPVQLLHFPLKAEIRFLALCSKTIIMAKANINIPINGKLGDYSAYKMKGVDHLVVRSKGGPSEHQMKNAPEFIRVRENMSEFAGLGKAAGKILNECYGVKQLSDYSLTGDIPKISKIIQKRDVEKKLNNRPIRKFNYLTSNRVLQEKIALIT